jgi:hypothetical protein
LIFQIQKILSNLASNPFSDVGVEALDHSPSKSVDGRHDDQGIEFQPARDLIARGIGVGDDRDTLAAVNQSLTLTLL